MTDPDPGRGRLAAHLVATRIAGDVATPRQSNLANITKMLDRHPDYWFGLELARERTAAEVVAILARRVGTDPDPGRTTGPDTIDVERCLDGLDAAADRIGDVARRQGAVLVATGHPTGLLALYLPVVAALAAAGCRVLTPAAEDWVSVGDLRRRIRYLGGVATLGTGGDVLHTHAPEPMQAVLAAAGPAPDLVVADHGWAGAAAEAGLPTVAFADTNDPALFVGAEDGKVDVAVPLDDNVEPAHYGPLAARLLRHVPTGGGFARSA